VWRGNHPLKTGCQRGPWFQRCPTEGAASVGVAIPRTRGEPIRVAIRFAGARCGARRRMFRPVESERLDLNSVPRMVPLMRCLASHFWRPTFRRELFSQNVRLLAPIGVVLCPKCLRTSMYAKTHLTNQSAENSSELSHLILHRLVELAFGPQSGARRMLHTRRTSDPATTYDSSHERLNSA
jgi:hypothetical protein